MNDTSPTPVFELKADRANDIDLFPESDRPIAALLHGISVLFTMLIHGQAKTRAVAIEDLKFRAKDIRRMAFVVTDKLVETHMTPEGRAVWKALKDEQSAKQRAAQKSLIHKP